MSDFDISEVARGRRITAVAATELEMLPRRAHRPKRRNAFVRLWSRVNLMLRQRFTG